MSTQKTKDTDYSVERASNARRLRVLEGELAFHLEMFGDALAKREGYKEHDGLDALHYYLIQKHHWLPSQARSLSWDDLQFLFVEEMKGWNLPAKFRNLKNGDDE